MNPAWTRRRMAPWLLACLLVVLLGGLLGSSVTWAQVVRVGVLSFRSLEQTQAQWAPTMAYLETRVPGYQFQLVPLFYPDLDLAVAQSELEFVFTNPEHFVLLRSRHGLAAMATLMALAEGRPVNSFGGVVVVQAGRGDLNRLTDLRNKVVAAPSPQSLGGYLMQRWALHQAGLEDADLKEIRFLGMPHDKSVEAVLQGKADAGFVRTGVLEAMAREGALAMHEIKVLNLQPGSRFPQLLSTELYPEWPFAAMKSVPKPLQKQVALALLSVPPDSDAARQGKYHGFAPPGDYSPIEAIMLRLRVHPDRLTHFELKDIIEKYAVWIAGSLAAVLLLALVVTVRLYMAHRRVKQANAQIHTLAFYDPLTRLPNRRLLLDRLHHALTASTRSLNYGALLFIDLDDFKTLNDSLGHDKGDMLLQEAARRLETCVRKGDTVARLGGDEFVIMLANLNPNESQAATLAQAVADKIKAGNRIPYTLDGHERVLTVSIGVTLFSDKSASVDELLKQADMAMYRAKYAGRDSVFFFDPAMQAALEARTALETELRQAIQAAQFALFYQLQTSPEGRPLGLEALLRWNHPTRGWLLPEHFLPLAEETGLIHPIGNWVLRQACDQADTWRSHPRLAGLAMAVNVSPRQFRHPAFQPDLEALLTSGCIRARQLKLELSEDLFRESPQESIQKMEALRKLGVRFSLDNFGVGCVSLGHLKRLPLEEIKIHPSFVRGMLTDANDAALAQTLIALGKTLGLDVVAEGVESEAQKNFLIQQGCSRFQGYLFGEPLSAHDLERRISLYPDDLEAWMDRPSAT
ncbi:MAG: EAL domain-containing protein [Pseudomonadota bacterium]